MAANDKPLRRTEKPLKLAYFVPPLSWSILLPNWPTATLYAPIKFLGTIRMCLRFHF